MGVGEEGEEAQKYQEKTLTQVTAMIQKSYDYFVTTSQWLQ